MNNLINQDEISKAVWRACDIFRGKVNPSNYKDLVLTMLFLRYISDVHRDELSELSTEYGDTSELTTRMATNQSYSIPEGCSFWDLYSVRHEMGNGERIDKALHGMEKANDKFRGMFQGITFNTEKLGDKKQKNEILSYLLEVFGNDALDLARIGEGSLNVIGDAYEFLIKHFAVSLGKGGGEFYTPYEVSDLLSILLEPKLGDDICDPACGSGSLLIKCGEQVQKNFNGSKQYALFGQEANGSTWSLAKMNMFLHGEENHHIEWGDTIRNPKLKDTNGDLMRFDVVTANPPFSLSQWGYEDVTSDSFGRFHRGLPPKTKGDYAFISHMIETLKPGTGRMGVVVPHGVLFRGASEGEIRKQLIDENLLHTVIGLPEKLFFGTGIPSALLIFNNNKDDEKVLFIDASREFKSGRNQNQLTSDNIQKIVSSSRARESSAKYAYLASITEIQENDYNLNIPRYVDTFEEEAEIDLVMVRAERLALRQDLEGLELEMKKHLEIVGL